MRFIMSALGFLVLLNVACKNEEPPPQFNYLMGEGDQALPPIKVTRRDKGLLGPIAGTDQPAAAGQAGSAAGGEAAPAPVTVDDTTPDGVTNGYLAILAAGQIGQMADIAVADQQDAWRQVAQTAGPLIEANAQLVRAMEQKGYAAQFNLIQGLEALSPKWTLVGIDKVSDTESTANLQLPGDTPATRALKLTAVDDKWRVQDPDVATLATAAQAAADKAALAESVRGIARQVEGGQLADADAVKAAVEQAIANPGAAPPAGDTTDPAAGDQPAGDTPADEQPAASPDTTGDTNAQPAGTDQVEAAKRSPNRRQRDEVDATYSGPNMLRNQ